MDHGIPGIALSGWFGGLGPGLLTTLLTAAAAQYFWITPIRSFSANDPGDAVGLAMFVVIGAAISSLNEAWRRATTRLARSEERLREEVVERRRGETERLAILESDRLARLEVERLAADLQLLMDVIPCAIWVADDPRCKTIRGNRFAAELFAVSASTNVSQSPGAGETVHLPHFKDGRELAPDELPMQRAAATGRPQMDEEVEIRLADGRQVTLFGGAVPLLAADGKLRGVVSAFADVTARKAAERALHDADRRKDAFLAMLSHELRNPLAAIMNANQILKQLGSAEGNLRWARAVIDRQASHLARLMDDLLDVSRISRGRLVLRREAIPVASAVAVALETSRPLFDARGQRLTARVPANPIWVDADATRLAQVISNLLSNASRYSEPGSETWLEVAQEGGEAVIRVRDEGSGIAPEALPRVFDMFLQAKQPSEQGGLGLGLALARRLAEMHEGTIEARSEGPGRGSEFVVRLPVLAKAPPVEAQPRPVLMYESARRRILVVDDNADAAEALALSIGRVGHEVQVAGDGPTALELAARFHPDVVILDIGLPGMDGYEVVRRLNASGAAEGAVLIALTGYGQLEDRVQALRAGFHHHLVKPVHPDAILGLVGPSLPQPPRAGARQD